jgi:uncharacterized membrane protein
MLLRKHLTGTSGYAWFEAGCPVDSPESKVSCAAVLKSPYSYWPVKKPAATGSPAAAEGYPVAFLGIVYYSMLFVWFVGIGRPSRGRRWVHLVPLLLVGFGLAGSAYFMYIMFAKLEEWCPWCVVTHGLNLLIALCVVLAWPRPRRAADPQETAEAATAASRLGRMPRAARPEPAAPAIEPARPSWRLAGVTTLAIGLLVFGEMQFLGRVNTLLSQSSSQGELNALREMFRQITGDPNRLLKLWDVSEQRNIPIRPDDPIRHFAMPDDRPFLDAVVFSDMECPSCKTKGEFITHQASPLFGGRMRLIYKHFPLDSTCNSQVKGIGHKNACTAAKIAEAARIQGGPSAFWRVHDLLFSRQKPVGGLDGLDPREVATTLGFDADRLTADMNSPAVAQRLAEDAELAKKLGIRHTPMIFVHGKEVESYAATVIGFWDALAESYWASIEMPRPDSARMKSAGRAEPAAATPSNQGSTTAP